MANLAIKGHPKRGKEVIERLEMLGGINTYNLYGDESYAYYTIDSDKEIKGGIYVFGDEQLCHFTLEEFEEKFPYKIGNTVLYKSNNTPYFIRKMFWENDKVLYELSDEIYSCGSSLPDTIIFDVDVEKLQPYKEENYCQVIGNDTSSEGINTSASLRDEENMNINNLCTQCVYAVDNHCGLRGFTNDFNRHYCSARNTDKLPNGFELQPDGYFSWEDSKPKYPNNYKECCKVVNASPYVSLVYDRFDGKTYSYDIDNLQIYENLRKLKICRDAYWKIAGDWKYDVNKTEEYFYIVNKCGRIVKEHYMNFNHILAFPTEEMCNIFYENFKELIERCKELL